MKKNFSMLFQTGLITSILLFTIVSCQKDEVQNTEQSIVLKPPNMKVEINNFHTLAKTNNKLYQSLEPFKEVSNNIKTTSKNLHSAVYNFTIDTTRIQEITTNSYKSYTFIVERDYETSGILENYVYTMYNDSTTVQYLISYPILDDMLKLYDINNASINTIQDDNLIYKSGGCASIVEYEDPVCVDYRCKSGMHTLSDGGSNCIYWGTNDMAWTTCTGGGWIDQGCGDGTNGGTNYDPTNSTTGGGSSGATDDTSTTDDNTDDEVVVPLYGEFVVPETEHEKNCHELQINSTDSIFKVKMQALKNNITGTQEYGFGIYNLQYLNPPRKNPTCGTLISNTSQAGPVIPHHPTLKSIAHNHLNAPEYNHIGTFAPKDLLQFMDVITANENNNSQVTKNEYTSYLVAEEGNYAIKIEDKDKLYAFAVKYVQNVTYKKEIDNYFKRNKIIHGKDPKTQNIGFLNLIKDFDLGIDLYQADENFENWEQLQLNDAGDDITKMPC